MASIVHGLGEQRWKYGHYFHLGADLITGIEIHRSRKPTYSVGKAAATLLAFSK